MGAICAISTALSEGAISVVRISGDTALEIAAKIFRPFGEKKVSSMKGYTCAYGMVTANDGERIDDAVLTVFRAPHSYTGEDVAEISCHGGIYVTRRILRLCCENGAVPAGRGEFTKLAFMNGKLTLTQAESVMDIISAQGDLTLRSANLAREGTLFQKIDDMKKRLVKLLGELSAWVDYPEEDLPEVEIGALKATLAECMASAEKLIDDYDNGMLLKNGVPAVIAGKPNVGKSTLMNMLLGYERAIVTDIAGTTRDVIEETVKLGDVTLRLCDTAGIRETADEVEKIGVRLARRKVDESALIIAVMDGSNPPDEDDRQLVEQLKFGNNRSIILINKSDVGVCDGYAELCKDFDDVIEFSAKKGDGCDRLSQAVTRMFAYVGDDDSLIFVNERQKCCLDRAYENLKSAEQAIEQGITLDAVTINIGEAAAALSELTGERITDSVVDEIFSKFCVGK
jgi:tRNA modification GTPase